MSKRLATHLAAAGLLISVVTTMSFASDSYFSNVYKYFRGVTESEVLKAPSYRRSSRLEIIQTFLLDYRASTTFPVTLSIFRRLSRR